MKALVLTNRSEPLVLQDMPDLKAGEQEAIVKVYAAALNHRDAWIQKGQYAGLRFPIILGSDGSGIVQSTGSPIHADWIGKEVIINPALNWGNEQSHQHPEDFKILGLPDNGTFAEFVKIPVSSLVPKPGHLSFEAAAALPLAGLTAYRAVIRRAGLRAGEKVLITGIGGGVALFALQYALATNAKVYVTSGDEEKIQKAKGLGAEFGANYKQDNWAEALRQESGGFDVIIDGAGGNGLDDLLNLAKPGGRIVLYGATQGNPANLTARRIFWKQLNIMGSTMGSPADFKEMVDFVDKNNIVPVVDAVFSFEQGEQAMQRMHNSSQFGKIVIAIQDGRT